jgi:glycosyltransferase involved in cell wall biosynthesis
MKKDLKSKNDEITSMKKQIVKIQEESSQGSDKASVKNIKDILTQMGEFHSLYNQMQLQTLEDKTIKEDITDKLKDIAYSQKRVDDIFRDLKVTYKDRLNTLISKVNNFCPESFGLAIREAAARGVFVVATNCGGVPEDLAGLENCILLELGDQEGLRKTLYRLISNPSSARSRKSGLFTDIEHQAKNLLSWYDVVLQDTSTQQQ